jgi:hypothetical protein
MIDWYLLSLLINSIHYQILSCAPVQKDGGIQIVVGKQKGIAQLFFERRRYAAEKIKMV